MSKHSKLFQSDLAIRHFVYQTIVTTTSPPTVSETAVHFTITENEAEAAYQRLHNNHFFFLEPNTFSIRMANPFSAVPTKFKVKVGTKSYWANCAWDMLGIPAALHQDATIEAQYEDTNEEAVSTLVWHRLAADYSGRSAQEIKTVFQQANLTDTFWEVA